MVSEMTPLERRRLLIDMSLRKQKPGSGSSEKLLRERTAIYQWPDLRQILQGILWAVVGGVATRAYMPERMTKDIDILIRAEDGPQVIKRLQMAGYVVISDLVVPGKTLVSESGVEIDLLFGNQPWLAEALAKRQTDPAGYPVLSLPYLVLMKLQAMRAQDLADISRMLGWAEEPALDAVRAVVARYSPEDSEDLESLIFIGQQERRNP